MSPTSKTVTFGDNYGELPVPTRSGFTFLGWYNGENVFTAETIAESAQDITLRARWQSDWTLESNKPDGREVVNTKWSYTEREYTTNGASSLSGWTKYDTKVTDHGSTQGPVYSNPSGNNRQVWSEQYVASYTHHWKYYHRYGWYNGGYKWGTDGTASSWERHGIDLTWALQAGYYDSTFGIQFYKTHTCPNCGQDHMWVPDGEYDTPNYATRWYYRDPIYTYYYYRDVNKESTSEITNGGDISNTQKWVKYIEK